MTKKTKTVRVYITGREGQVWRCDDGEWWETTMCLGDMTPARLECFMRMLAGAQCEEIGDDEDNWDIQFVLELPDYPA